jgi:hypothetical protein
LLLTSSGIIGVMMTFSGPSVGLDNEEHSANKDLANHCG